MNPLATLARRALSDPKFRTLLLSLGPAAAKMATDLAKQGRWRQLAVVHADTVVDGSFAKIPVDGQPHWIVWSADEPIAAYPPHTGDLGEVVKAVDLDKRQRPDDLRSRALKRDAAQRTQRIRRALPRRGGRPPTE